MNVIGGYGGDPYGFGPFGTTEVTQPRVTSAVSLNGFEIEVFFSEDMDPNDPALLEPTSYSLEPITGAAPATVESVSIEKLSSLALSLGDALAGVTSVVLRHTGTTLGGTYKVHVLGPTDISGNEILDVQMALLTKGETPAFTVTPTSGNELLLNFAQALLPEEEYPDGASSTLLSASSYVFTPDPTYPITITPVEIEHPVGSDPKKVRMEVKGMTSLDYTLNISPASAIAYDGTVLPSAATTFEGAELAGPVFGTSDVAGGALRISLPKTDGQYGWTFVDTSDRLVPGSNFRLDITFNASGALIPNLEQLPEFEGLVLTVGIDTGPDGELLSFDLAWDGAAQERSVRFNSGNVGIGSVADLAWDSGEHTVSMAVNRKAGTAALLYDGTPILTTLLSNLQPGGTPFIPGRGVALIVQSQNQLQIDRLRILDLQVTASSTVYSAAWNVFHDETTDFEGDASLTRDTLLTQRGPLVKGWGDATPATVQDVQVLVQDEAVEVASVNPYIGEIKTVIPIPLLPPDEADVKVDYQWFASPVMPMARLNTPGLVLNRYEPRRGHHSPAAHGSQNQVAPGANVLTHPGKPKGAPQTGRFPMSVVLGPVERRKPLFIGHRYMGFEREYSALLNSPTTLRLNQSPNRYQVPGFEYSGKGDVGAYDGVGSPTTASPAWTLTGVDGGAANAGQGTYTLKDAQSGTFTDPDPVAFYSRQVTLKSPSAVYVVGRFEVSSADPPTPDGVFTGVGFGLHDGHQLYLVGCLLVNDVQHVGMLLNPEHPEAVESWQIGPKAQITLTSQTTAKVLTSAFPEDLDDGDRFQVLDGPQAGVYTITHLVQQTDGTTTLTVEPEFPAAFDVYGNKYPDAYVEMVWDEKPSTYRLEIDPDQQVAQLTMSGERTGVLVTLDGSAPVLPAPARTSLMLPGVDEVEPHVFWGSMSRSAKSTTTWSFFRYGIVPDVTTVRGHALSVRTEMGVAPEDNKQEWALTGNAGFSVVDSTADGLLLKKTLDVPGREVSFGYARTEVFLTPEATFDITAKFRQESGRGVLDTLVSVGDTERLVLLGTLAYAEGGLGGGPYRQLFAMPAVTLTGLLVPDQQGWEAVSGTTLAPLVQENRLLLTQDATHAGGYVATLETPALDDGGRVFEARFAVLAHEANANGDTGILLSAEVGLTPGYRSIGLTLRSGATPGVRLVSGTTVVREYDFDWTDEVMHSYRVVADEEAGTVLVYIDDTLLTPTLDITLFSGGSGNLACTFGLFGTDLDGDEDATIAATVALESVSCLGILPVSVKRTLGVFTGKVGVSEDYINIDKWEIPRTDSSTAPNSAQSGPVIEEMDWREDVEVRMLRDPEWGVIVFRPDLPLPPYYQPEVEGQAGTGFTTQKIEPSAGWINVETRQVPREASTFGLVKFGAFNEGPVQQRWQRVNYNITRWPEDDVRAPQNMVLNRFNVISSGERTVDRTLETVIVQTLDSRRVSLKPTHIYASRIYKVIDGSTIYTSEMWSFDPSSQTVTLLPDNTTGEERTFSSAHANVTVVFAAGQPVTNTYLKAQPLLDSITKLNEGTPPVPKSQTAKSEKQVYTGGGLNNINNVLNSSASLVLNDPQRILTFTNDPDSLYEQLNFFEVDDAGDTGLISTISEATLLSPGFTGFSVDEGESVYSPEGDGASLGGVGASAGLKDTGTKVGKAVGGHVLDLSGTQFWQETVTPKKPAFEQGGGMPGHILFASGGSFVGPVVNDGGVIVGRQALGGVLGPGTAVLYPTAPAGANIRRGVGHGRIYKRTDWFIRLEAVIVDATQPCGGSVGGSLEDSVGTSLGDDDSMCEVPLIEEGIGQGSDNTPPSAPHTWPVNPSGSAAANGLGAALAVMQYGGDYSRYGPWGGMAALSASVDYGVILLDEETLALGAGLTIEVVESGVTTHTLVYNAAVVPASEFQWALSPQPHINLAAVINNEVGDPSKNLGYLSAEAGTDLAGRLYVRVESTTPVTSAFQVILKVEGPGLSLTRVALLAADEGVLSGGSKIQQSSLLAGGDQTIRQGEHDPKLGIVSLGGEALPSGLETTTVLMAS